jgi:hypothetical protein
MTLEINHQAGDPLTRNTGVPVAGTCWPTTHSGVAWEHETKRRAHVEEYFGRGPLR